MTRSLPLISQSPVSVIGNDRKARMKREADAVVVTVRHPQVVPQ